jgi:hypothetical protein
MWKNVPVMRRPCQGRAAGSWKAVFGWLVADDIGHGISRGVQSVVNDLTDWGSFWP